MNFSIRYIPYVRKLSKAQGMSKLILKKFELIDPALVENVSFPRIIQPYVSFNIDVATSRLKTCEPYFDDKLNLQLSPEQLLFCIIPRGKSGSKSDKFFLILAQIHLLPP